MVHEWSKEVRSTVEEGARAIERLIADAALGRRAGRFFNGMDEARADEGQATKQRRGSGVDAEREPDILRRRSCAATNTRSRGRPRCRVGDYEDPGLGRRGPRSEALRERWDA